MKKILFVGSYVLAQVSGMLPYCWFQDHKGHRAFMRNDGLIYISGHTTKDKAIAWAKREKIIVDSDQ